MPQIIVVADPCSDQAERYDNPVMFTERVTVQDFESQHFQSQLVERLGWAVGDADAVERNDAAEAYAYAPAEAAEDWDDEPREEHTHDVSPPLQAEASAPHGPRRGRLSAVGPAS
jgi:hypothetical protein